jgi:hypothetical protein
MLPPVPPESSSAVDDAEGLVDHERPGREHPHRPVGVLDAEDRLQSRAEALAGRLPEPLPMTCGSRRAAIRYRPGGLYI